MTTRTLRLLAALAPLALAACTPAPPIIEPEQVRQAGAVSTQDFIIAAIDHAWRVAGAAELGLERSQDPAVTAHARAALADWNDMARELTVLAQTHLPGPVDMSEETERLYERLSQLSGAAFDDAYRREVAALATAMTDLFDAAYESSADPAIRAFIRDWRDVVAQHGQSVGTGA